METISCGTQSRAKGQQHYFSDCHCALHDLPGYEYLTQWKTKPEISPNMIVMNNILEDFIFC